MKRVLPIVLILMCGIAAYGQGAAKPTPVPPATAATTKQPDLEGSSDASKTTGFLLTFMEAETMLRLCSMVPDNEKCKGRNPAAEMSDLYAQAAKNPELTRKLVSLALNSYSELKEGARSAAQVSQAADESSVKMQLIVIAQNQRIIELLEQLVKKKP